MPLASFQINPWSILTFSALLLHLYSISSGLGIQAVDLEPLLWLWPPPGLLLSLESKGFFYISPEKQALSSHWLPNLHFLIPSAIFILDCLHHTGHCLTCQLFLLSFLPVSVPEVSLLSLQGFCCTYCSLFLSRIRLYS